MPGLTFEELTKAVGGSLADAQTQLTAGVQEPPTRVALSDATLELKVAVENAKDGKVRLTPVSADAVRSGAVQAAALSTVTLRFAAFADDPAPAPVKPAPTNVKFISEREAIRQVSATDDLTRLERALGPFKFDALLIEPKEVWLVTVTGADGSKVREAVVPAAKV